MSRRGSREISKLSMPTGEFYVAVLSAVLLHPRFPSTDDVLISTQMASPFPIPCHRWGPLARRLPDFRPRSAAVHWRAVRAG
jgi:hypothetical protein